MDVKPYSHPVIDADGHLLEFAPLVFDRVGELAGRDVEAALREESSHTGLDGAPPFATLDPAERRRTRSARLPWWTFPTLNTLDRATALLPALMYERLPEFGIDFAVLYPSMSIPFPHQFRTAELRQAACRAFNSVYGELYAPFADRVTAAGLVPMHSPAEAIGELRYAVETCGTKTVVIPSYVARGQEGMSWPWLDTYGLDSEHDYDPFWAECIELGVSVAAHSPAYGMPWNARRSVSNFVYNHIGTFADSGEALCKSLFLGGVTRRFPGLRVAFLEGGVGWGARLYADLVSHYDKRSLAALEHLDPANLDRPELVRLARQFGGALSERYHSDDELLAAMGAGNRQQVIDPAALDEFAACGIERRDDIRALFAEPFFFGCEADDPTIASAFSAANPMGARIGAIFGSDIGHWDVQDMTEVVPEAYEEVERGRLSTEDFRAFVFENAVRFFTDTNPSFFDGTAIEGQVVDLRSGAGAK